jgi:hypothetical protein
LRGSPSNYVGCMHDVRRKMWDLLLSPSQEVNYRKKQQMSAAGRECVTSYVFCRIFRSGWQHLIRL